MLNKYVIAAMEMLAKKDERTAGIVTFPALLRIQIAMNKEFGQGVVLKTLFEKGAVLGGKSASD